MRIVCFGSLNADLAVRVPRLPEPDETLIAHGAEEFLGGKGANQATAAARLGAEVTMVGMVGTDAAGDSLLGGLDRNGVDHHHVERVDGTSGLAFPLVADDGGVSIIIVPGANGKVDASLAERATEALAAADVLLLQGEVPVEASVRAAQIARDHGTAVVVNPAPVPSAATELLALATTVIVNRPEAAALALDADDRVVLTLGSEGVRVAETHIEAFPADVVDPTGAGDAFCAAFAVSTAAGLGAVDAARIGAAAGSWAVRTAGAEPSLPTRAEVESVLGRRIF